MHVLVIGSGGREHAICDALKRSPSVTNITCAPGNGGIGREFTTVTLNTDDHADVIAWCWDNRVDLVMIGPEAPLVDGLADSLRQAKIPVFGPSAKAAQLEGSKDFTKALCRKYGIPTAAYATFADEKAAVDYVVEKGAPIVVKADGLAAGKGVTVAMRTAEAVAAVEECFSGKFGEAGAKVVIEECMFGTEVSFFALCDGETALPFGSAQDHKRAYDGDEGPNTGGMGTFSPSAHMTPAMEKEVMERIILPSLEGMKKDGAPFTGVLFAGLMLTAEGPKLVEYNTRFGDPETQVLMRRLKSDLGLLLKAGAEGKLKGMKVELAPESAVCVVYAAKGYPGEYVKNTEIRNLEQAAALPQVKIYHAGTAVKDGKVLATGGRVLGVTATGNDLREARERAYAGVDAIDWKDGFCRRDIGGQ